jgi:hypothetical protein
MNNDNRYPTSVKNNYNSGFTDSPLCAKKAGDVSIELMNLNDTTDRLQKTLVELFSKISPILSPNKPCNESCDKNPEPIVAPLAEDLKKLNQILKNLNGELSSVIERIQL